MNVKFSDEVEYTYYDKHTGKITRTLKVSGIPYIMDEYIYNYLKDFQIQEWILDNIK
jgi:hypothetical protein